MKQLYILILTILIVGCNSNNTGLFNCDDEKKLIDIKSKYLISLDTIKTYNDFYSYVNKIQDTISDCSLRYSFIFNYKDSCFKPDIDTLNNLQISGFYIFSNHCGLKLQRPEFDIYLTSIDTVEIISLSDTFIYKISKDQIQIKEAFNKILSHKLSYNSTDFSGLFKSWIHICIKDTFNFKDYLLPTFKILLSSYLSSTRYAIIKKYSKDFCVLDDKSKNKIIENLNLKLWINSFDGRVIFKDLKFKK